MKFYYSAISTLSRKKLVGSVSTKSEGEAREKLNKAGMAILSITTNQQDDWSTKKIYEFEVLDKRSEKFSGEIVAKNRGEVYDRLEKEFKFKKINYICESTASEEEKIEAYENSVREIILKKQKEEEEEADEEMRTFSGSLKALAKMKITDDKKEREDLTEKKPTGDSAKLANEDEEDFTKKTEADFVQSQKNEGGEVKAIEKVELDADRKNEEGREEIKKEIKENAEGDESNLKKIQIWKNKFIRFFPSFSKNASKFYYYFTEIVVPPKGKTRNDGWIEMKKLLFPTRDPIKIAKIKNEVMMKWKAFFERLWISLEEVVDVLAAVFLAYFALGILALYIKIPRISELAESTLRENFTIPFFAGVFIFFRLLLLIREKFTSWSFLRTLLLFLVGGAAIGFVGINLF